MNEKLMREIAEAAALAVNAVRTAAQATAATAAEAAQRSRGGAATSAAAATAAEAAAAAGAAAAAVSAVVDATYVFACAQTLRGRAEVTERLRPYREQAATAAAEAWGRTANALSTAKPITRQR